LTGIDEGGSQVQFEVPLGNIIFPRFDARCLATYVTSNNLNNTLSSSRISGKRQIRRLNNCKCDKLVFGDCIGYICRLLVIVMDDLASLFIISSVRNSAMGHKRTRTPSRLGNQEQEVVEVSCRTNTRRPAGTAKSGKHGRLLFLY
jgi:hypothetical protein